MAEDTSKKAPAPAKKAAEPVKESPAPKPSPAPSGAWKEKGLSRPKLTIDILLNSQQNRRNKNGLMG